MENKKGPQDVNPLRDILFALVWVGVFFALIILGCKEYKQKKDEEASKMRSNWRYLEPIEDQRIIWRPHKVDTNIRNAIRANLFREY